MLVFTQVAVTGIPSCGKSSVCHFFEKLGAHVESADAIVHHLLTENSKIGQKVITLLGPEVVENGQLCRRRMAELVFQRRDLLHALEALLHPEVKREIAKHSEKAKKKGRSPLFVVEVPLLFEAGMQDQFDKVITVIADEEACRQRFVAKTGSTKIDFDQRLARQWSQEKKAEMADYVIENNAGLNALELSACQLFKQLSKENPSFEEPTSSHEPKK